MPIDHPTITADQYRARRETLGTQAQVAARLGTRQDTISRRESGRRIVTPSAWKALCALRRTRTKPVNPHGFGRPRKPRPELAPIPA